DPVRGVLERLAPVVIRIVEDHREGDRARRRIAPFDLGRPYARLARAGVLGGNVAAVAESRDRQLDWSRRRAPPPPPILRHRGGGEKNHDTCKRPHSHWSVSPYSIIALF